MNNSNTTFTINNDKYGNDIQNNIQWREMINFCVPLGFNKRQRNFEIYLLCSGDLLYFSKLFVRITNNSTVQ